MVSRTAVVEQLLANGTSRSWLLGNVLVTVTVSKRTPSNMPCAYCSAGKISINENVSTPLAGIETKSATVDQRAVGGKIPSDIKNHVSVCWSHCEDATYRLLATVSFIKSQQLLLLVTCSLVTTC